MLKSFLFWALFPVFLLAFSFPSFSEEKVRISLSSQTDGKESYYPGDDTGYKLFLKNDLSSSWVRIEIETQKENFSPLFSEEDFSFFEKEKWVKRGGFWYCTEKIPASSSVLIIDGMTVPSSDFVEAGAVLTVTVRADAVRSSEVEPDFSLEDPWKGKSPDSSAVTFSGKGSHAASETLLRDVSPEENFPAEEDVKDEGKKAAFFGKTGDTKTLAPVIMFLSGFVLFAIYEEKRKWLKKK